VRIALRGINKKGVEIGELQNRCHNDTGKCVDNFKILTVIGNPGSKYFFGK